MDNTTKLHTEEYNEEYYDLITQNSPGYLHKFHEYLPNIRLIYNENELVGWMHLNVPCVALYSGFIFIYIFEKHRRLGIGTAIYRKAERLLAETRCNWWSSYPESDEANLFALSVGFDYTNTNSFMVHDGRTVDYSALGIRSCAPEDYPEAPDIWKREYAAMHIRIGLPYHAKVLTEEEEKERREDFIKNIHNYYVLEVNGEIIGVGCLFSDNSGIGSLAIDRRYVGNGYGTRLAAFLTNECVRRGCRFPRLYCESKNDDAMHIYKKIGYVEKSCETVAIKN